MHGFIYNESGADFAVCTIGASVERTVHVNSPRLTNTPIGSYVEEKIRMQFW